MTWWQLVLYVTLASAGLVLVLNICSRINDPQEEDEHENLGI